MTGREVLPVDRSDVGFDPDSLYSARLLNASTSYRVFVRWVLGLLTVMTVVLFIPWQQNVRGDGEVTALRPQDRPQTVPALIAGRIEAWNVAEGQYVTKGTRLVEISEVDEKFLDPALVERLAEQVEGKTGIALGQGGQGARPGYADRGPRAQPGPEPGKGAQQCPGL